MPDLPDAVWAGALLACSALALVLAVYLWCCADRNLCPHGQSQPCGECQSDEAW